jgi:hypothetical protein
MGRYYRFAVTTGRICGLLIEEPKLSDWDVDFTLILSLWTSMGRPRAPSELAGRSHTDLR